MKHVTTLLAIFCPYLFFSQDIKPKGKIQFSAGYAVNFCTYCPQHDFDDKWTNFHAELESPVLKDSSFVAGYPVLPSTQEHFNLSVQKQFKKSKFSFSPRISYSNGYAIYGQQNWTKASTTIIDTLSSTQSPYPIYLKQVEIEKISYEYSGNLHSFLLGALADYQMNNFFTFYTGLEFGMGFSTKNRIGNTYTKYEEGIDVIHYENTNYSELGFFTSYSESSYRTYSTKGFLHTTANLPLGVKVRLSKKENFLRHFSVSYEFRLQRSTSYIKELYQLTREYHSHLARIIYEL